MLLDNQEFLKRLEILFQETKDKSSIWLWFKQCPDWVGKHRKGKDLKERKELQATKNQESEPFALIVRVKSRKRKYSTKVLPDEAAYFQRLLHNILLVNCSKA